MLKKGKYAFSFLLLFLFLFTLPAAANDHKVADRADLLTEEEEADLQQRFLELAQKWNMDAVYATVTSLDGKDTQTTAEDFYDNNGYGIGSDYAGIILFIDIGGRNVNVTAEGSAQNIFTMYGLRTIREEVTEYLSEEEFYRAGVKFAELIDNFQAEAAKGTPYSSNHTYKNPLPPMTRLLISVGAGIAGALIVFFIFWSQLESVHTAKEAENYVKRDSFHLTRSNDLFLYHTVTKTKIETSGGGGGSHTTSGGHSASGSSGKF